MNECRNDMQQPQFYPLWWVATEFQLASWRPNKKAHNCQLWQPEPISYSRLKINGAKSTLQRRGWLSWMGSIRDHPPFTNMYPSNAEQLYDKGTKAVVGNAARRKANIHISKPHVHTSNTPCRTAKASLSSPEEVQRTAWSMFSKPFGRTKTALWATLSLSAIMAAPLQSWSASLAARALGMSVVDSSDSFLQVLHHANGMQSLCFSIIDSPPLPLQRQLRNGKRSWQAQQVYGIAFHQHKRSSFEPSSISSTSKFWRERGHLSRPSTSPQLVRAISSWQAPDSSVAASNPPSIYWAASARSLTTKFE